MAEGIDLPGHAYAHCAPAYRGYYKSASTRDAKNHPQYDGNLTLSGGEM